MTTSPTGRRARKAARTREEISRAAIRLFARHGFDAVTMTDVAEAADVGRATLFAYYPTKESLVLERVSGDDPCAVVRTRAAGVCLVEALRAHYRRLAARVEPDEVEGTRRIMELIMQTPALTAGLQRMFDHQRDELAALLADEDCGKADGFTARVVAAQAIGVVLTVKSRRYERLVAEDPADPAAMVEDVDRAFDMLATGIGDCYRRGDGQVREEATGR